MNEVEEVKEAKEAIFGSICAMHFRDVAAASDVCRKYLGRDLLSESRATEFEALPTSEQERMTANRDFEKYGLWGCFAATANPEVPHALMVIQSELAGVPLSKIERSNIQKHADKIITRFPAMTPERINRALAL